MTIDALPAHTLPTDRLPAHATPAVYVIHDNPEWIPPFSTALEAEGVEFVEWLLPEKVLDLSAEPPEGIFWSRLSASSHTRTDPHVKDYGRAVLAWLEAAGRRVINGSDVYELEVSKIRQHRELAHRGFDVPKTSAVFGYQNLVSAARDFTPPFVTKHNQGGKGLGVRRFNSLDELATAVEDFAPGGENESIDGIVLIQEYVEPAQPYITRAEFIGGAFHYAVKVDISGGSFELCPADACQIEPESQLSGSAPAGLAPAVCSTPGHDHSDDVASTDTSGGTDAAGASTAETYAAAGPPQFQRREEITAETPLVRRLSTLLHQLGVELAGVEFIETADGRQVVYDINTNTNYNPDVESSETESGRIPATRAIAQFTGAVLREHY